MACAAVSAGGILPSRGGGWRRWSMGDARTARASCPASRRYIVFRRCPQSPSVHASAEASRARRAARSSRSLNKCSCTIRRRAGTRRRTRVAWCVSMVTRTRRSSDVSVFNISIVHAVLTGYMHGCRRCVHCEHGATETCCSGCVLLPEDLRRRRLPRGGTAHYPARVN